MNLRGTWFKHFKGTRYLVIAEATDTETGEQRLIYQSEHGDVWDRPKKMFMETLPDGQRRFEPIPHDGQKPVELVTTIELRRTEAVIVIHIMDGDLAAQTPDHGDLRGERLEFTLEVQRGQRSHGPDDFFDEPFELSFSYEHGRFITLADCQVPLGSYPMRLEGTYDFAKSTFGY